jgi:hypothetical protein
MRQADRLAVAAQVDGAVSISVVGWLPITRAAYRTRMPHRQGFVLAALLDAED